MLLGVGPDVALKVDVVTLLDVVRIQCRAERKGNLRLVCVCVWDEWQRICNDKSM